MTAKRTWSQFKRPGSPLANNLGCGRAPESFTLPGESDTPGRVTFGKVRLRLLRALTLPGKCVSGVVAFSPRRMSPVNRIHPHPGIGVQTRTYEQPLGRVAADGPKQAPTRPRKDRNKTTSLGEPTRKRSNHRKQPGLKRHWRTSLR